MNPKKVSNENPWDNLSSEKEEYEGKLGFDTHQIKIEKYKEWGLEPEIGSFTKLWGKPETDVVFFYEGGSIDPEGCLGFIENKEIANHIRKDGLYHTETISYDSFAVIIELTLKDEYMYPMEECEKHKKE